MMISSASNLFGSPDLTAIRQERFKKTDTDGDGKISKEELSAVIPSDGKGPSVDEIFSKFDTDGDGAISDAEDQVAFAEMQKNRPQGGSTPPPPPDSSKMATDLFKATDADSDGKITKAELTSVLQQSSDADSATSAADEIFEAADTDGDGNITQAELAAYLEKMRAEHQPPPPDSSRLGYDQSGQTTQTETESLFSATA